MEFKGEHFIITVAILFIFYLYIMPMKEMYATVPKYWKPRLAKHWNPYWYQQSNFGEDIRYPIDGKLFHFEGDKNEVHHVNPSISHYDPSMYKFP